MAVNRKDEARGPESRRVAAELRVRIADGGYPPDTLLPSQHELATEFGVSRDTIQRVLRELRGEGWIETRQGQGSRVLRNQRIQSSTPRASRSRHPMTLGPLIGEAFEQPEVALDIYTLTAESVDTHIRAQAERIRLGLISPDRIALRIMLPTAVDALPYPKKADAKNPDPDVDARLRARLRGIAEHHIASLHKVLGELRAEGLVDQVEYEFRHTPLTPTFKLYVINRAEVLHGPYIPLIRPVVLGDGGGIQEVKAVDVLGLGATLTHHVRDGRPDSPGSTFVESMTAWFEAVWTLLTDQGPAVR
ncbi:winged helix-turn-helix domain-containing protein [Streptomyces collinus]|uniref:winged helix-turn-helix domain-containing protein n=1 Tax=Streptomyces collinus TaxID=42684 RepID=UPI003413E811